MRKFKFLDSEFDSNSINDVAPVLLAEGTLKKTVNVEELHEKYKGVKIYSHDTYNYDEKTREFTPVTYYYAGAKAIDAKEYIPLREYDSDFPPENMLIETTLQAEEYKRKFYTSIKNHNCTMMTLIDYAIEDILEKHKKDDEDYFILDLFDDGGWPIDIEVDARTSSISDLVTSIRLVELAE